MHGVMLIGYAIGGDDWWSRMKCAINDNYVKAEDLTNPSSFLLAHFHQNVDFTKDLLDKNDDDVALLLHKAVLLSNGSECDQDGEGEEDVPAGPMQHPAAHTVNVPVVLSPSYADHSDAKQGPLCPGETGMIVEFGGENGQRFNVRAPLGETWWYDAAALLVTASPDQRPGRALGDANGHPSAGQTGIQVQLADGFMTIEDASGGPMKAGDVGEVLEYRNRETHQWRVHIVERNGLPVDARSDWWYSTQALIVHNGSQLRLVPETLLESSSRIKWERAMNDDCLADLLRDEGLSDRLQELESHFSEAGDEGAIFKEELLERFDVNAIDSAERKSTQPGLWLHKRPFSFAHFASSLTRNEQLPEQYPVLSAFLEKSAEMASLRHLPQFFRWLSLLMQRYDKRLDRNSGRNLAVGEILREVGEEQQSVWREAFAGFKASWDLSWHSVGRFGCLTIPKAYLSAGQDASTMISFSLPGQSDEGICPNALADYLIRIHNDFVARVDQVLLMRGLDVQRHSTRKNEISSSHLTRAHCLIFNTEGEFMPYVHKHCVHFAEGGSGDMVYDFEAAEKFLIDRYFYNKPLINLSLPGFSYADDVQSDSRASLKAKVNQEMLPSELEKAIRREFTTPAAAQSLLRRLETCINFLNATGGTFVKGLGAEVGDIMLADYLSKDLLMAENQIMEFGQAVRQQVQLKHLESLWTLLQSLTDVDIFANVLPQYCAPIETEASAALTNAAMHLDLDVLLPALKDFITTRLISEGGVAPQHALKDTLDWVEYQDDYLADFEWFETFPRVVANANALECYQLLERLHTAKD